MWNQFRSLIIWLLLHPAGAIIVPEAAIVSNHLAMFCPDVDVCPETIIITKDWNDTEGYKERVACCKACSCDDACAQTNSCCFPPTDQHPGSTCLYSTTQQAAEGNALPYKSYRMIDRDVSDNLSRNTPDTSGLQNTERIPCGEVLHPPFGSLLPVYSKRSNKIYKNPTCATSQGVKDGVIWETRVVCRYRFHPQTAAAFQSLAYGIIPNDCYVDFMYPGNEADLDLHVCYRDVKETCDRDTFPTPERLNVTASQVRALCKSGLRSPWYDYTTDILYANVFCIMCDNTSLFKKTMKMCALDTEYRNDRKGLSYLLHMNRFEERGPKSNDKIKIIEVCDSRQGKLDVSRCRELKCPMSQLRRPNGQCAFMFYKKEDTNNYMIVLRVHIANFKISSNGELKESMDELIRLWNKVNPWPRQGNIYCELNPSNSSYQVKSLLVEVIVSPTRNMAFEALLKTVKTYINKKLVIEANGSKITLHQSLAEFSRLVTRSYLGILAGFYKSLPTYYTKMDLLDLLALNVTEPLMLLIHRSVTNMMTIISKMYITELYYCEQVELQSHEFIIYTDVDVARPDMAEALYNKLTGRLMFENEFVIVYTRNDGIVARICLSDSGFKKKISTTYSGAGSMHLGLILVLTLGWSSLHIRSF